MSRGRYRQGRYQQGIGIPETLGVQPTTWTEPKEPNLFRTTWTSPNAGISRNYGSTPGYVDTVPHRWDYGKSGQILNEFARRFAINQRSSATAPAPPSPFSAPPSGPPATGSGTPPAPPAYPAPTGTGVAVPPPPSVRRATSQATSTGQPFATPPAMPSQGVPVPPPPSTRRATRLSPIDTPPMAEQGSDLFTMSVRTASDEPFRSNVEWRDEPENPLPMGPRATFDSRRMFDPDYLPAKERSTSPANSRAQNRRPKRT